MIKSVKITLPILLIFLLSGTQAQVIDSLQTQPDTTRILEADSAELPSPDLESMIDEIVNEAIMAEAFPGCVIYAATPDTVIYYKAYGYHTYDSIKQVRPDDIYDLASITKVTAATLALMKLYENGLINLDDPINKYIDGIGNRFGSATFRSILAHQAGLYPWIPYYQEVRKKNGKYKPRTIGQKKEGYGYALNDSLYLHDDFYQKIKKMIKKSEVSDEKVYKYSGLFFYLVPELVEKLTGDPFEVYLDSNFYDLLGTETLMFNPTREFERDRIVPTENDTYFRMKQLHGVVHDEGAITMRGISGNAGLFSNAEDLAKVWLMLLNEGSIDTTTFLKPTTVQLFTTAQYPNNSNRRGLGFDKPLLEYDSLASSVAKDASYKSYGHSGYTGTLVWADPKDELLFIFLSNRVYPSRENRNLYDLNVRPKIHQLIYDFLKNENEFKSSSELGEPRTIYNDSK